MFSGGIATILPPSHKIHKGLQGYLKTKLMEKAGFIGCIGLCGIFREIIKAEFYGQYFDVVICNDSGLYFEELDFEDLRQPGLNIRTPMNMDRLSDEEMIDYYSKLIAGLGGKVTAYYLDGIAVYNHGVISSFMDNMAAQKNGLFYMIDKASSKRFEGWPLDSLSINKENGKYFVDGSIEESKENIIKDQYQKSVVDFLIKSLHIA